MQIETKRLIIRHIVSDDWKSMKMIWEDFNRSEYVGYDNPKNTEDEDLKNRIARWADATRTGTEHMFFAICIREEMIGFASFNKREQGYEIGYGFRDEYKGKGYAKESLNELCQYMKKLGAKKIYAGTAIENIPSVKLLNSIGFKMISTEKVSFYKDESGNDIYFEGGNFELLL